MSATSAGPGGFGSASRPDATPPAAGRGADVGLTLAATILAGVLAAISLTGRSLGFDEGATVTIVSGHGHAFWHAVARDGGNMSGYYLLMHLLVEAFGDGLVVLRGPSVVFAALTAGLTVRVARALWGDRRVAGLAGLLTAISLPLVYWGQTARGYAAMTCFACAAMLAFVRLLAALGDGRPVRWAALGYVIAMGCAAYCGFIVLLLLPAQLLALAAANGRGRHAWTIVVGAMAAVVALCVPIIVLAVGRGSGQLFWVPRPEHQVETQVMQLLTASGMQSTFHRAATTTTGWIVTSVMLIGLLGWVGYVRRRGLADRLGGPSMELVLSWIVVPGLVAFVTSFFLQPTFTPRNFTASVPAVALAVAAVIADRRLPRWLAGLGLGVALVIRLVPLALGYGVSPEPWQPVTARVLAATRPGDCVAFYPLDGHNAFGYYVAQEHARARAPRSVLPAVGWSAPRSYVEIYRVPSAARIASLRASCSRLWFVSSHEGQQSGPPESVAHRREWLALRASLQREFGSGPVHAYGWASVIHVELMPGRR